MIDINLLYPAIYLPLFILMYMTSSSSHKNSSLLMYDILNQKRTVICAVGLTEANLFQTWYKIRFVESEKNIHIFLRHVANLV